MTQLEVSLPDQTESEIRRLIEQGEFINWDQAVEKILARGIQAYDVPEDEGTSFDDEMIESITSEQQDPAMQDEPGPDDQSF